MQRVPYFRPDLQENEIEAVVSALRSGWLTTGPSARSFEMDFAAAVRARYAVAVNSCTAAMHLALEALGLQHGQAVLVPAMTFAATAEVVRHLGATPILVDCHPVTGNMCLADAEAKLNEARTHVAGIMPVHVGGLLMDMAALRQFAARYKLWVVEDAAHAFPAAWRPDPHSPWQRCGESTADVTCFSFYANKTITTGEGGMAVCADQRVADRMRLLSLHGLSSDTWDRASGTRPSDYQIIAPGFKYNLADPLAALGLQQLARAEAMRQQRERIAQVYTAEWRAISQLELPPPGIDRVHSWHLYPVRLKLDTLRVSRDEFAEAMTISGVGYSVHWRPLHLHPYYQEAYGARPHDCPVATALWPRLISMPIFPGMRQEELEYVVSTIRQLCRRFAR